MPGPLQNEIDFWFEFDDYFKYKRPIELLPYLQTLFPSSLGGEDAILQRWTEHYFNGTYPDGFRREINSDGNKVQAIKFLSQKQLEILDRHFQGDALAEQKAFEDFGQGILYDVRRKWRADGIYRTGDAIHLMDSVGTPPVGYPRWHAFIKARMLVDSTDATESSRWDRIDHYLGLSWAIRLAAETRRLITTDSPTNPGLPADILQVLRTKWLNLSSDQLDAEWFNGPR